ncbi:hypothetical protein HPB49_015004 [Dermacentor silvarum]|uniref:Uncharacterized protein n=1 Tax=Dermacentor silvarum TaxID=543639 RepID=A0ACB8CXS7_DERSI|nr:hypothetical protein HPB49_015004 [Dermacentor silvarum]
MEQPRLPDDAGPSGAGPSGSGDSPRSDGDGFSPRGDEILAGVTVDLETRAQGKEGLINNVLPEVPLGTDTALGMQPVYLGPDARQFLSLDEITAHQQRIEKILFDDKTKSSNPIRAQIITEVNSMVKICAELSTVAANRDGVVEELRRQLDQARREAADLRVRLATATSAVAPPRSYAAVVRAGGPGGPAPLVGDRDSAWAAASSPARGALGRGPIPSEPRLHGHLAFLTPMGESRTPAKDVLTVLKANIEPSAAGIGEVSLRETRFGVTVLARERQTIVNLQKAVEQSAVTKTCFTVRIPEKRRPHVKIIGADPEIAADRLLQAINERNPGLDIDLSQSKVKTTLAERGGNKSHVVEMCPTDFHKLIKRGRVNVGWTSARVVEDLHVSLCTHCAAYGHSRRFCPDRSDASKAICTKCAEAHLAQTCRIRMGDVAVCCAVCRGAGRDPAGHPAGDHRCPALAERVARIRARTDYG